MWLVLPETRLVLHLALDPHRTFDATFEMLSRDQLVLVEVLGERRVWRRHEFPFVAWRLDPRMPDLQFMAVAGLVLNGPEVEPDPVRPQLRQPQRHRRRLIDGSEHAADFSAKCRTSRPTRFPLARHAYTVNNHPATGFSGAERTELVSRLLTVNQAAEALNVSRWTIYRLVRNREIRAVRVGERLRFRTSDLESYLDRDGGGVP